MEGILDQRGQKYLVKWKDYNYIENTWEPLKNLANCQQLLQQFHHQQRAARPAKSKSEGISISSEETLKGKSVGSRE